MCLWAYLRLDLQSFTRIYFVTSKSKAEVFKPRNFWTPLGSLPLACQNWHKPAETRRFLIIGRSAGSPGGELNRGGHLVVLGLNS